MKIKPSLRVYVLLSMLISGVGLIWTLSALSNGYFITGMDMAMRHGMLAYSQQQTTDNELVYVESPENPTQPHRRTLQYNFVQHWQDLPPIFTSTYQADDIELNELYKNMQDATLLMPPKTGFFLMKIMKDGTPYYVSVIISHDGPLSNEISDLPHVAIIAFTALGGTFAFTLILLFVMRRVTTPVEKLKDWAKQLDDKQLKKPIPDFHYSELNTLATLIRDSLSSVQNSLDRERQFLGYASHELRTPIAVTRTNGELLKKLIENNKPPEKQLDVVARILRASFTMTDLTETLLWLNRRDGKALDTQDVQLGSLTTQLVTDLTYLTQEKAINIEIKTDEFITKLPESVCRIVISNLIRNAFQHTLSGHVSIIQSGLTFSITNQSNNNESLGDSLGFGLGLELTERLITQHQWQYTSSEIAGGKHVTVTFQS
ncbi:hypothetical protein BCU70_05045 [Vibrio sp. 10N.286.49.C2]|uniref:sensor histidine kinase n=1 Tax=unclassified Vibrio TaxID=2614977 RepID=UPI000C843468|nr:MULTISPECIES: HAMP domain-containing sensor histidine kinase [unclassified Vibrio]PMH33849.1 hypothetical protein BCU70_05045 [Vibrio sp. 10N.286.49.C2]PMH44107.1 hypothetical protein BCU66_03955 [Vibrio sp. 10N.286.49.B1]PMH80944.1 hypothetical protein BCU58_22515 [Vibrio sp. 10N.286.48.B7]